MQKTNIIYGVAGLIIGLLISFFCTVHHRGDKDMHHGYEMKGDMKGTMSSMTHALEGKTGDDFDKAFIEEMIMHHEGAVGMAEKALEHSNHAEIKTLSNAIISAQTKEINEMKVWYKNWFGVELPAGN